MKVLVLNCGSSSIKYKLLEMPEELVLLDGLLEEVTSHHDALEKLIQTFTFNVDAVVHRVVHGGEKFKGVTLIDDEVKKEIKSLIPLAPLHNPANLEGIEAAQQAFSGVSHYGVFDTAFHQSMPLKAYKYALPSSWYEEYGVRRYGFHGSSHEYIASHFRDKKIISIHLGNGASICAIKNGKSVDTSMGFTPLEGLVMGTRCGDVDVGILTFMRDKVDDLDKELNKKSGLKGLCGTNDMRTVLAHQDSKEYKEAVDIYVYRIQKYIGAYIAVLQGIDTIVFTAGIGENSAEVRQRVCEGLEIFNIKIDENKNRNIEGDFSFVEVESSVKIAVLKTDEELMMAREAYRLL